MMAIANPADWVTPTAAPITEISAEPEATAQAEFAALLAASYTAPPVPITPTVVVAKTVEASPKREAVAAATEFVLPTDALSPVAASPMLTGVKAAEVTINALADRLPAQLLAPTDPMAKAAPEPPLISSARISKANAKEFVEPIPNPPTAPPTTQSVSYATSAPTPTPEQVEHQAQESFITMGIATDFAPSSSPQVAVPQPSRSGHSSDVRVAESEASFVNTQSDQVIARSPVAPASASFFDLSVTAEQLAAPPGSINQMPSEAFAQALLMQGNEQVMRRLIESTSPGNAKVLKPAVAAVKTIVAGSDSAPLETKTEALLTTISSEIVQQAMTSSAETAPPVESPISAAEPIVWQRAARQEFILSASRPTPVEAGRVEMSGGQLRDKAPSLRHAQADTMTESVPALTPTRANNFAVPASPARAEFINVPATQPEFTNRTVSPTQQEFTNLALPTSAQKSTAVTFAAAVQAEESGAETTLQSSLLTATQSIAQPSVNSLSRAEAPAGNETPPLVRQTSAPIIELAQGLEAPASRALRLQLNPIELGRVEVEVKRDAEGQISAVLKVEQTATAQTLTHSLGQLRESLERAGLVVEQLDVTLTPPLASSTSQPFGQQFGQQPAPQHSSPTHFTNASALAAEAANAEASASAAEQKLLSLHA
jgi:hypothetical protein